MKSIKLSLLLSLFAILVCALPAFAQGETFSDENVDYTFKIPEDGWKMTSKPSSLSPNVEYVYQHKSKGHLEVRKISVKDGETLDDVIRNEETKLQFKRGFVAGKEEIFRGALLGKVFNFEFLWSGKAMSGRYYFLQADKNTIYVLRFEALRDDLRTIRNQMDIMARTLKEKTNGKDEES